MIPARLLLIVAAALALVALAAAFVDGVATAAVALYGLLFAVAAVDGWLGWRTRSPEVERTLPRSLSLAAWVHVKLTLRNTRTDRALRLRLIDHCPESFHALDLPQEIVVAPGRFVDSAYRIRPTQRGQFAFSGVELRIASPAGLWWRKRFVPLPAIVRVYPNYSTITRHLAVEVDSMSQRAGVRLRRRRGEGTEFHQLREYREGDSIRAIDWKATARISRLIAREYQEERDQQVVFVADAGRRMLAQDGELSHFDHTLNAMLLLSYVALRRGDAVGVMTVGERRTWLAPRKGADAVNAILNHVYDVQPVAREIDLVAAATELAVRQRRRALVVVLTNVRDELVDDLISATSLLGRRHLVVIASLRESAIDEALSRRIAGFDDALDYAGTNRYLEARRESHDLLRARGVFVDDCLCTELPTAITNRYLAIKRAGLL